MKLTAREKWLLFWEGIITIGILVLLDWSVLTIIDQVVHTNESFQIGIFEIKSGLSFGPEDLRIWSYQWLGILIIGGLDLWFLIWRLARRYRALQMDHILSELHYIAEIGRAHV